MATQPSEELEAAAIRQALDDELAFQTSMRDELVDVLRGLSFTIQHLQDELATAYRTGRRWIDPGPYDTVSRREFEAEIFEKLVDEAAHNLWQAASRLEWARGKAD